jgi:glutamine---fructose-6-phosphate transaminase (isomerizing)
MTAPEARAARPESALEREIREQPEALQRFLDAERDAPQRLASLADPTRVRTVLIAARGSSDNAARYAQYLLGVHHGLPVALATPSVLTVYGREPRLSATLVVGVSQSGRSPDIVAVLDAAQRQGQPTLAVTNDPASPLAAVATEVLPLHCGPERSVAATKTYLTSLAALALLSAALETASERGRRMAALHAVPEAVAATVDAAFGRAEGFARYASINRCMVVGRGFNYGTAFEISLKLKELTGIVAEPFSPADLLHGPIAAVGQGFPVLLLAPEEPSLAGIRQVLAPLARRGADLLVISGAPDVLQQATTPLPLPRQPASWLTPLVSVVPGQVMALRLAQERGADLDHPPGLTKVTETF